jgi:hypothetical protein
MLMNEQDPLRPLLHEWQAPEPSPALDVRVRAAYRAGRRAPWWQTMWTFRVSIPVPVLAAALLLIAASVWIERRANPPVRPAAPSGYITRLESAGFQPLPDGDVRVVRSGVTKQ